jgi:hypothetical protein
MKHDTISGNLSSATEWLEKYRTIAEANQEMRGHLNQHKEFFKILAHSLGNRGYQYKKPTNSSELNVQMQGIIDFVDANMPVVKDPGTPTQSPSQDTSNNPTLSAPTIRRFTEAGEVSTGPTTMPDMFSPKFIQKLIDGKF